MHALVFWAVRLKYSVTRHFHLHLVIKVSYLYKIYLMRHFVADIWEMLNISKKNIFYTDFSPPIHFKYCSGHTRHQKQDIRHMVTKVVVKLSRGYNFCLRARSIRTIKSKWHEKTGKVFGNWYNLVGQGNLHIRSCSPCHNWNVTC